MENKKSNETTFHGGEHKDRNNQISLTNELLKP